MVRLVLQLEVETSVEAATVEELNAWKGAFIRHIRNIEEEMQPVSPLYVHMDVTHKYVLGEMFVQREGQVSA